MPAGSIGCELFRRVMGNFATGVTIVTTRHEDIPHGMTVNALTSVSLQPILLLFCAEKTTRTEAMISRSGIFAVNILTSAMRELADRFAGVGLQSEDERFLGIAHTTAMTGAPILEGSLAWLDCRVLERFDGGDHAIFLAEVVAAGDSDGDPLIFYGGQYASLNRHGDNDAL